MSSTTLSPVHRVEKELDESAAILRHRFPRIGELIEQRGPTPCSTAETAFWQGLLPFSSLGRR